MFRAYGRYCPDARSLTVSRLDSLARNVLIDKGVPCSDFRAAETDARLIRNQISRAFWFLCDRYRKSVSPSRANHAL